MSYFLQDKYLGVVPAPKIGVDYVSSVAENCCLKEKQRKLMQRAKPSYP